MKMTDPPRLRQSHAGVRAVAGVYQYRAGHLEAERITHGQITLPDVAVSWLVLAKSIVIGQGELEEAKAIETTRPRLRFILMAGEARHHGDIGVDSVPNRGTFALQDGVVIIDPLLGLSGIDKGKR
jgi:hypothetical protein